MKLLKNIIDKILYKCLIFNEDEKYGELNIGIINIVISFFTIFNRNLLVNYKNRKWLNQKIYLLFHSFINTNHKERYNFIAPLITTVNITNICSSNCSFCYSKESLKNQDDRYISLKVIENLTTIPTPYIILTGGDPLSHPMLDKIIQILLNANKSIYIAVNAAKERLIPLIQKYHRDICFIISFYGCVENHDKLRGNGNFSQTIHTIETLNSLDARYTINCVSSNGELDPLYAIVNHFIQWNPEVIAITRMKKYLPISKNNNKQTVIRVKDNEEMIKFIARRYKKKIIFEERDLLNFRFNLRKKFAEFLLGFMIPVNQCGAGNLTMHIDVLGNINPCFLYENKLSFGKVTGGNDFYNYWNNNDNAIRNMCETKVCFS